MDNHLRQTLTKAVALVLRPLIKLWVRKGLSFSAFEKVMRWVFVDVVDKDFRLKGRKQTDSRISVITGLTRHQVHAFRSMNLEQSPEEAKSNRATRVLSGWLLDKDYHDAAGAPAVLDLTGDAPSFSALVQGYGGDISPRAVLDELVAQGSVERTDDGKLRMVNRGYIPTDDESAIIEILGYDAAALISTLEHNLNSPPGQKRFQKKVCYEHIPEEDLQRIKEIASRKAQALLEELNELLARSYEKDPQPGKTYHEIGLGIYFFEKDKA